MYYDTIIIGGGAAGMCTAIKSKKENHTVLIIDHKDRVGKKILSTGNGKCNLTNRYCKISLFDDNPEGIYPYFPEENRSFVESVISRFDCEDTIEWFHNLGIRTEDKNGYIYPLSEQASSVLDILRYALQISGVEVITSYQPINIKPVRDGFVIDDDLKCKQLVLACGGMAAPKTGSDGSGYELAKSFGHTIVQPRPSLCGLKCKGGWFKTMQGVRSECRLSLCEDSTKSHLLTSYGNVQFNSYGISGIPSMQLSSFAGKWLEENASRTASKEKKLSVNIEFLPEMDFEELVHFIADKIRPLNKESRKLLPLEWVLTGLLNKKVISVIFKEMELNAAEPLFDALGKFQTSRQHQYGLVCGKKIPDKDEELIFAARTAGIIKHFNSQVTGLCGFEEAQVTGGGVSVKEIDPETMQSRLVRGLYFAGEILDVDGICGGYNLQWAWASASVAAEAIKHTN